MPLKPIALACILAITAQAAGAAELPSDCLASFDVKPNRVTADLSWALATGKSAALSCGAGELTREKLFVEGGGMLKEGDLVGTPADLQASAVTAYSDLQRKIQALPGDDVPGTLFAAGGYLYSKYKLAACILTAEEAGGTCWASAASFIGGTYKFFQKVYKVQDQKLSKGELLATLAKLKPATTQGQAGPADQTGSRSRWIALQTNLCRAIQRDCL